MSRSARQKIERPEARVYDLHTAPVLSREAEATRKHIGEYLGYMERANRKPDTIHLKPGQYDAIVKSFNRVLDSAAPPCAGLTYKGIPVARLAFGGLPDAP